MKSPISNIRRTIHFTFLISILALGASASRLRPAEAADQARGGRFNPKALVPNVSLVSKAAFQGDTGSAADDLLNEPGNAVSADGRYVAFTASGSNFLPGLVDANNLSDVFLLDRVANTIQLCSRSGASATTTGNGFSLALDISDDGRFVLFLSRSTDLGFTDANNGFDVFLFDRVAGTVQLCSRSGASATTTGNGASFGRSVLSADGRFVVFLSQATDLGFTDDNGIGLDMFLFDRTTGTVQLVSRSAASATTTGNGTSLSNAAISADGRFVAFTNSSSNLGFTEGNTSFDVFLFDRTTSALQLVSRTGASATTTGNAQASASSISADGRYVVFTSAATDHGFTNANGGQTDVFLFDRTTSALQLVSRSGASATTTGNNAAFSGEISADGRWVVFLSQATDLGFTDTNGASGRDVILFDRTTNSLQLVSRNGVSATTTGDRDALTATLNADGRFIAFMSFSTDHGFTNANGNGADVVLFDRTTSALQLVSRSGASATTTGNGASGFPSVSADGNFVAFQSAASDLGFIDGNGPGMDFLVFNRSAGTNQLVSRRDPTVVSASAFGASGDGTGLSDVTTNADGRFVAYFSKAVNLVPGQIDLNNANDVFLYDRMTDTTQLVSHVPASATTAANGESKVSAISADGRFVVFLSQATDFGFTDANGLQMDVFLFDRTTGEVRLVSRSAASATMTANGPSNFPAFSADGRFVAFSSSATDLGVTDANGTQPDIFLFDRTTNAVQLVSRNAASATMTANTGAFNPTVSDDGRYVAYTSGATDLGFTDANTNSDVFLFDRTTSGLQLVSRSGASATATGNNGSSGLGLSADGRFVLFTSVSSNLGFTDANATNDVFLFDRTTSGLQLVSRSGASATTTGNNLSSSAAISGDGRWIVFQSASTDHGFTDSNATFDLFLFDRTTNALQLVSRSGASATTTGNGQAFAPSISGDGRHVAFVNTSTDLGFVDSNNMADIVLYDRAARTLALVSRAPASPTTAAGGTNESPAVSRNGLYVAFNSPSAALAANDLNSAVDVFLASVTPECPTVTATVSGSTSVCLGSPATVAVTVTGGTPPYTVTLNNGGGTMSGNSPLMFTVNPTAATTYAVQSGADADACPVTPAGSATITIVQPPTQANAGTDRTICNGFPTVLGANQPSVGTGMWSVVMGPSTSMAQFDNPALPNATFTPAGGVGNYVLRWTISNPPCTPSTDDVVVTATNQCPELSTLYVADTQNHRVQKFDGTAWTVVVGNGVPGLAANQCNLPKAVTANSDGSRIYVADTGNNRITFSTDGGATWAVFATSGLGLHQVRGPQGLALDGMGNLYVADALNERVLRFAGGMPGTAFALATSGIGAGQVKGARGVAVDLGGNLFVTDRVMHRLLRIANAANVTAADTGVAVVSGQGLGLSNLNGPEDVAVDNNGNIYVADTLNERVIQFPGGGTPGVVMTDGVGLALGKVNRPEGVTAAKFTTGGLAGVRVMIVGDTGGNRIEGRPLATPTWQLIGTPNNLGSLVGQFRAPSKIR